MRPDRMLYLSYALGGVARFVLTAALSVAVVYIVGFISLMAYLVWSAGWDLALLLVERLA